MDELNKRKRKWDIVRFISHGMFFISAFVLYVSSKGGQPVFLLLPFAAVGGIGIYVSKAKIKEISNEFKDMFVKDELEARIPGSTFDYHKGIDSSVVSSSHLVKLHERYKTEDLITGSIEDVKFRCADVHVQDVRRSGKRTTVVTTFQGRFYEFDFPKNFKSNVFLLQPGQFRPFSGFKKMKLESIKFNSEFKIYSNNEHDTFYILTPQLMERLLKLDSKYRDKIGFSFKNSKLFIAIDSRVDAFDVMGLGDITSYDIDLAVKEIENIIEFVHFLRLNDTLFK